MAKYDFTLILVRPCELTDELADALFAAGCDDGSPGSCQGVVSIDFHRESDSLENAIRSAISAANAAGCVVERVELDAAPLNIPVCA